MTGALVIDPDGVYDPRLMNDRLLLGLKGTMSEYELSLLRQRGLAARNSKASRGALRFTLPPGLVWSEDGRIELDPDERVRDAIQLVFAKFQELGSARQAFLWVRDAALQLPVVRRNGIARRPDLFVIARNSTFIYKGKSVDVKQVGRELGVRYVLEGSIQGADDSVRITAQLIDAATGATVMGAEQPALGEAEDEMDRGQAQHRVAPAAAEIDRLVLVAGRAQPAIALPAVGGDRGGRCHVAGEEARQAFGRGVWDGREAQPAEPTLAALAGCCLAGTGHHGLAGGAAARSAWLGATDQRLVGLHPLRQRLALRPDHRFADLVRCWPGTTSTRPVTTPGAATRRTILIGCAAFASTSSRHRSRCSGAA